MPSRIPTKQAELNDYVTSTIKYLQQVVTPTNGTRLGLTTTQVSDWETKGQLVVDLYAQKNDPNSFSKVLVKKYKTANKAFRAFAQPILNVIASSLNANDTDAKTFRVVLTRKKSTRPQDRIKTNCYAIVKMIGGTYFECKCRSISDSKRASLAPGVDGVEIAYVIGDKDTKAPDADSIEKRKTFSKAVFTDVLGTASTGKVLYIYFRWTYLKHPLLAGPWSDLYIISIS